jgi:hypothetical protein
VSERRVESSYRDPLELIWIRAAERLGWKVERSAQVYASFDGAGTLTVSDASDFDRDDSLAQMIFHEICHALVAGPGGQRRPDWGLSNTDDRDLVMEHACHRLQAALSAAHGLRMFMAVTTVWRPYWDSLPADPLRQLPQSHTHFVQDPAIAIAQSAFHRAELEPFRSVLHEALSATAVIAAAVRPHAPPDSLWAKTQAHHVTGFLLGDAAQRCGTCAWAVAAGASGKFRCRQAARLTRTGTVAARAVLLAETEPACECWEPELNEDACGACGACCREGFDLVQVSPRELIRKRHPHLVQASSAGYYVPRPGGTCVALCGEGSESASYRCQIYEERPRSCRDFSVAGEACLVARRRVGLSR